MAGSTALVFDLLARDRASRTFAKVGHNADSAKSKIVGLAIKGGAAFGLVTAAAGVFAYKVGSDYVNSLNQIQALTGANDKQMRAAASTLEHNAGAYAKMGQTTGDAASGVVELTKSGLSLHNALKSVYGTMTLAKAGELSVADASSITANALNTFHLKAKQAGDVANYLANAANISSADVSDIAESFKYVAPVAASAGVSIQQVNAILAELANAGLKGSQAGTTLRTMLINLQAPSSGAQKVLDDLGVSITNASGDMKPIGALVGELGAKLNKLPGAQKAADLKQLFGKTGMAGASVILSNGVKGLEEYTKGVGKAGAASRLAESRSKGLAGSFAIIKASAISGAQSIYRQFSPIADRVIRPLATKFAGFAQNIGPDMQKGMKKIGDIAKKLNLSGVGKNLATQAKAWATPVISGFTTGLDTGNWSGLGKALGNGIVKALGALGDLTKEFGKAFSKIDWVGIGITVGKEAPSFLIGLAAGILNFDLWGLLKGLAKHWQDVLLAVLAVAFTPGKVVGKVGELLAKIPFAGKLLEWGLLAFKRLSDRMVGWAWDALKFMGRGFLSGFRKVFPEVGRAFAEELTLFPTRIGVMAIHVAERGLKMIRGLGSSIAKGTDFVMGKIGELIGHMLKPWVNANTWLVRKGVEILGGLLRGLGSKIGDVLGWVKSLAGRILGAIPNPLGLLQSVGRNIISGLWTGLEQTWSKVTSWISSKIGSLSGIAKKVLGIRSPSRVFAGIGVNIMEGLHLGLDKGFVKVQTVMGKLTNYIQAQGQKLQSLLSAKAQFAQGFQSFTTSVFSTDLSHTTTDMAGNDVTTPGTISDMLAYQAQQRNQARSLRADVKRLHKLGLSNALIKQLQASGESGIAQIHTLAGGSKAQIRQLNALDKQTRGALHGAGEIAGGQLYNAQIAQTRNNEDLAERIAKKLHAAMQEAGKNEYAVVKLNGHHLITAIREDKRHRGQKSTGN